MLIDAGPNESEDNLIKYLRSKSIKKIDYVIATHVHEDHIAGLNKVISTFDIGQVYMPKSITTTKTYSSVIDALKNKNLKINTAKEGVNIDLGGGTTVEMYSPGKEKYDNLNNYSPIMKLTYGNNKFLFTGDAEKEVEEEVLQKGVDLKADVLKVGHHGSNTATTSKFLDAVNPQIAVISVGKNNTYGHPHKETLDKLAKKNIKTLKTEESGTIEVESDGKNLTVKG